MALRRPLFVWLAFGSVGRRPEYLLRGMRPGLVLADGLALAGAVQLPPLKKRARPLAWTLGR